jgi:hypothetical protein
MGNYYFERFAQAYGVGSYGSCTYSTASNCSASTATNGNSSSVLTNTGFMVAAIVTLACLIIFVSLLARWWRRPRQGADKPVAPDNKQPREQ